MNYYIIYDGNCNLCTNLVQVLEKLDKGNLFQYVPMQDKATLQQLDVTAEDCEMGMILINAEEPEKIWQGSDAAEEIGRLLPMGKVLIDTYRAIPGAKWLGDRVYAQIRDRRYELFGKRSITYHSAYPIDCDCRRQ